MQLSTYMCSRQYADLQELKPKVFITVGVEHGTEGSYVQAFGSAAKEIFVIGLL